MQLDGKLLYLKLARDFQSFITIIIILHHVISFCAIIKSSLSVRRCVLTAIGNDSGPIIIFTTNAWNWRAYNGRSYLESCIYNRGIGYCILDKIFSVGLSLARHRQSRPMHILNCALKVRQYIIGRDRLSNFSYPIYDAGPHAKVRTAGMYRMEFSRTREVRESLVLRIWTLPKDQAKCFSSTQLCRTCSSKACMNFAQDQ